jgi:hypothetical protein
VEYAKVPEQFGRTIGSARLPGRLRGIPYLTCRSRWEGRGRSDLGITGRVMLTIALAGSDDQRERWVEAIHMRAPGVTVDPLRGMTGHAHLNDVVASATLE